MLCISRVGPGDRTLMRHEGMRSRAMKSFNWSNIHESKKLSVFTALLAILSFIYGLAVRFRLVAHRIGALKTRSLSAYILSIGNITVGGTGKTPFVAMLAEWADRRGFNAAILSRGYKGKWTSESIVVSDGREVLASVDEVGDEAVLLARKLSSIPVLASKKRHTAGELAVRRFGSEILLLDDGYQHLSLYRDLNILLIDARRQFGNGFLLPRGPLREPLEQIRRADLIVITKCTTDCNGDRLEDLLRSNFPDKPVYRSGHFPDQIVFPVLGETYTPDFMASKKLVVFAGLAHPADFLLTVESLGAHVVHFEAFPDHHLFAQQELGNLVSRKEALGADFLLTTEKDWVRIDGRVQVSVDIAVLKVKMGLLSDSDTFFEIIMEGIGKPGLSENEGKI
jgi:tetraacyldisaccharide 4'-kinase